MERKKTSVKTAALNDCLWPNSDYDGNINGVSQIKALDVRERAEKLYIHNVEEDRNGF